MGMVTYCRSSSLNSSRLLFFFSYALGTFLLMSFFDVLPGAGDDSVFVYSVIFSTDLSSCLVCGLYNLPLSRLSSSAREKRNGFCFRKLTSNNLANFRDIFCAQNLLRDPASYVPAFTHTFETDDVDS